MKSAALQYANTLADIALEQGAADAAAKQLTDFAAVYAASAELRNFLASPAVAREAKHGVVEKIAARLGASKIIRNFLLVVVNNRRTMILPDIVERFQEVIRQRTGVAEAEVRSAVELNAAQKSALAQMLARLTGKRVETTYALDPALLGGAIVRIGDTVYDGSLRHRLDEMRAKLTE